MYICVCVHVCTHACMSVLNGIMPHTHCDDAPPSSHGQSKDDPSAGHGKPLFQLLVRGFKETPKVIWAIAIIFGYLPLPCLKVRPIC